MLSFDSRGVRLRPETPADRDFLEALYASTRTEELKQLPWPEATKAAFLKQQFEAQTAHYAKAYYDADFSILERGERPIGRLYVFRNSTTDIRIVDIALVPEETGKGLGTILLRGLQEEAAAAGKALSIHVEQFNPARRLYDRLGFVQVEEVGVYFKMEWRAR